MKTYEWARKIAMKNPQHIAVSLDGCHLSYGKLESLSNRLAGILLIAGVKLGDRVALLMKKTPDAVIALHGIHKAGAIAVPIGEEYSKEQAADIIKESSPSIIIMDKPSQPFYLKVIQSDLKIREIPWIWWSKDACKPQGQKKFLFNLLDVESHPNYAYSRKCHLQNAAFLLFYPTYNGQQAGVIMTHNSIEQAVFWAVSYFDMEPQDRISGYAPLHSDTFLLDVYASLYAGAHFYPVPSEISLSPFGLSEFMLEHDITHWSASTAALNYMALFQSIPENGFSGLKRVLWRGNDFASSALQLWMQLNPKTSFTRLYGRPETGVVNSFYPIRTLQDVNEELPLGTACTGFELLILDSEMNDVRDGMIGDLYISGKGLNPGYWNYPAKTKKDFIDYVKCSGEKIKAYKTNELASCTSEGIYYYHGKAEEIPVYQFQLKELEMALGNEKWLREYAVVPVKRNGLNPELGCAYVTAAENIDQELPPKLRKKLKERIPEHMIPKYWKCFEKLPRNGNGTIDKKFLSEALKS